MSLFVLLYQSATDPTSEEEGAVLSGLTDTTLVDRSPGCLLVDSSADTLRQGLKGHPLWSFSPAHPLGVSPPHHVKV